MALNNRYDFVMLFDVENGNPNGDPDAGNAPRIDAESGLGYITDVCLKRKIRNYVELVKGGEAGFAILVKADRSLNAKFEEAYDANNLKKGQKGKNSDDVRVARDYMCRNYYDVRMFGAVMSTGDNPCGIVRGPVQINFARSGDRMETGSTEMGKKSIIPYALYRAEGYVSAALANRTTDLSEEDLELLWNAIINMFEEDHSAARGKMCMRKLIIFRHDNVLGSAPSHILFDKISIHQTSPVPRSIGDYEITIDRDMPEGVELIEKL